MSTETSMPTFVSDVILMPTETPTLASESLAVEQMFESDVNSWVLNHLPLNAHQKLHLLEELKKDQEKGI